MAYSGEKLLLFGLLFVSIYSVTMSRSYDKRRQSNDYGTDDLPMHGPSLDNQALPNDLNNPYPGKKFGPMGPIDRSFPDVSLRNLENGNDNTNINDNNKETVTEKPLREYQVFHVEFHRVETPIVIGIWIFFASIAKIGKLLYKFNHLQIYILNNHSSLNQLKI